ncbi:MAG TPA: HipA family kinase [Terriglobales bacterium]|nr:HipA family kinase [Terriglobales bacterium]
MPLHAVQHVRRLRGGAQAHLMRASDGHFYVVKFQNNPQHLRVLANELLATRLAERLGLPVPVPAVIEVSQWLIAHTPDLTVQLSGKALPCRPGLQFGSRYAVDPAAGQVFDYLPEVLLEKVRNLDAFAGVLALDKWTCNANGRQAVYWRAPRQRKYTVSFIDQGYCFNAGEWSFPDSPLRGVHASNAVYAGIRGWESLEPWLSRLEALDSAALGELASEIPPEWYEGDWEAMEKLVAELVRRRPRVRQLIADFRRSSRNPFPEWKE